MLGELELMIVGVKPVCIVNMDTEKSCSPKPVLNRFEELVEEGQILLIDKIPCESGFIQIFAHADKVRDGMEVVARYFHDGHGYPFLKTEDGIARVGKLLGYTNNDIAWCVGTKYKSQIIKNVMKKTANIRRKIRHKYLLEYGSEHL